MKKILISTIALCILLPVFAQKKVKPKNENETNKKEIYLGLNLGVSLVGILNKGMNEQDDSTLGHYKYFGKSTPVFGFAADGFLSKKVSCGLNFTLQTLKMDIDYWVYDSKYNFQLISLDNKAVLRRSYFGGKFLYHYLNNNRVDLFSGIKVGIVKWSIKLDKSEPELQSQILSDLIYLNRPAIGLIPLGFRIKVKDNISFISETILGAPNFITGGITYTINE
ncbi:MAG: hypothetical protein HUU47_09115 [Bacteroidetes bacterium]|nr:hypothetical protein [Bacteroidota bacterium]